MSTLDPTSRSHHRDHAYYEELLSGAALGILTPEEQAEFSAYLETEQGATLRDELADFTQVVSALPLSVEEPDISPSPALRDRLQAMILDDGSRAAAAGLPNAPIDLQSRRTPVVKTDPPRSIFDSAPEDVVAVAPAPIQRPSRLTGNRNLLRALAAIALVVLLSGAVFAGYQLAQRDQTDTNGGVDIALTFATPMPSGVSADLRYYPETSLLMLSTKNMPAAPADHVYQVWLIGANGPVSMGMMEANGFATVMSDRQYTTLAITVEPGPAGSPGPTTNPIVVASLEDLPSS